MKTNEINTSEKIKHIFLYDVLGRLEHNSLLPEMVATSYCNLIDRHQIHEYDYVKINANTESVNNIPC